MERGESLRRRDHVESVVGERFLEFLPGGGGSVDQKVAESLFIGKGAHEILFGDDQLALENAVVERGNQPELHSAGIKHIAYFAVQDVGDRVRIRDRGNRAVGWRGVEQRPWVGGLRNRFGEGESSEVGKLAPCAEDTRAAGLIEIQ